MVKFCASSPLQLICILTLFSVLFTACETDTPAPIISMPEVISGDGVLIVNEGNYGWGNASLSYYQKSSDEIFHELFRHANGDKLGDVFQSVYLGDEYAWLVVNNSGKIECIDLKTFNRVGSIHGLISPRFMLSVGTDKAYVSDLFGNRITIINLASLEITGKIEVNGWTESLVLHNDRVLVTGVQSGFIYAIDPATDQITDSLAVPPGPISMVKDADEHIWVLSGEAPMLKNRPALYQIAGDKFKVSRHIHLPGENTSYSNLAVCPAGEFLYILGDHVYRLDLLDSEADIEVYIPANGRILYGLSVDPANGDIYVTDAIDFVQPGIMFRYHSDGTLITSHKTGLIPGGFAFP